MNTTAERCVHEQERRPSWCSFTTEQPTAVHEQNADFALPTGQVPSEIRRRTTPGTRGSPGGCYGPLAKQTNHKRHLVSACFALGSCAGCSNMPVQSLTRTRRRRRTTGRVTKRGIRQERRPSLARRVGIAHSPAATARRREDRAPFASLSNWFEKQHRKARGCSVV